MVGVSDFLHASMPRADVKEDQKASRPDAEPILVGWRPRADDECKRLFSRYLHLAADSQPGRATQEFLR